ncbi:MAG TPA: hypothetical protein VFD49_17630 [Candidatus Dormibacteraeota bacterium]|nr:hypothetical protein [Candidatus Dormibacteraeota bacterium]
MGPRLGVAGVGGHQALLDGEHRLVGGLQGAGPGGGLVEPELELADGLGQAGGEEVLAGEAEFLHPGQELVGVVEEEAAVAFGHPAGGVGREGEGGHARRG